MENGRRGHFTCAWRYADEVREGEVDDLRAGRELVEGRKGDRICRQHEGRKGKRRREARRSVSNAGDMRAARARIEHRARRRAGLKDGPFANGYVRMVSDFTNSARCEAAARLATRASAFAGAAAQWPRVR